MKKGLFRYESLLFPLACLCGLLLGNDSQAIHFFCLWLLVSLCSLCADGAFRNAAARQGSLRQVDRRFFGSIAQALLGTGIVIVLLPLLNLSIAKNIWMTVAAGAASINLLFVERLRAHNRGADAKILAFINALLLTVGFAFDPQMPAPGMGVAAGAGLTLIISVLTLVIVPSVGFSIVPRCIARAPAAIVQDLLYPAAAIALCYTQHAEPSFPCLLAGMILWRGARTVCRRSESESAPLNFWITLASAAITAAALFDSRLAEAAIYIDLAVLCAAIVFAHLSWRIAFGTILICAVCVLSPLNLVPQNWTYIIGSVLCAAAPLLNLKHAYRRWRAGKRSALEHINCRVE